MASSAPLLTPLPAPQAPVLLSLPPPAACHFPQAAPGEWEVWVQHCPTLGFSFLIYRKGTKDCHPGIDCEEVPKKRGTCTAVTYHWDGGQYWEHSLRFEKEAPLSGVLRCG